MSWLQANAQILNALVGVLVLGVWAIYLHLFWRGYRRQLRASIIISRGAGSSLDALCLVSNMSREAVFIEGIVVFVEWDGRQLSTAVTELSELSGGGGRRSPREGPLKSGDYIDIGTFRDPTSGSV